MARDSGRSIGRGRFTSGHQVDSETIGNAAIAGWFPDPSHFAEALEPEAAPMTNRIATRRSDAQLGLIMHETANWSVKGPGGAVLCEVASLCCALERAEELTALGCPVIALGRARHPEIVVLSGQMRRMRDYPRVPEEHPILLYASLFDSPGHVFGPTNDGFPLAFVTILPSLWRAFIACGHETDAQSRHPA